MPRTNLLPSAQRFEREFELLGSRNLSAGELRHEVAARITRVIPADGWCISSVDPHNMLITDTCYSGIEPEMAVAFYQNEYREPDYGKHLELVRGRQHGIVLSALTEGRLQLSNRYRTVLVPLGYKHELRLAVVSGDTPWGLVHLYRRGDRPDFTADELAALARSQRALAETLRMSAAEALPDHEPGARGAVTKPDVPATMLINTGGQLQGSAGPAAACVAAFTDPEHPDLPLPIAFQSLVFAALCADQNNATDRVRVSALGRSGEWWTLSAAPMRQGSSGQDIVVITGERVIGADMAELVMRALGLTLGERRVCELVLDGASTSLIARTLHISDYTVQDRLKGIFAKAQVGSRGELVAMLS